MKAFISYSSLDATVANEIVSELERNDIECFIAPRDIRTGHVYAEEIVFGMDTSQVVVLVLTENSNNSQHVLREIERAVSNKLPIISYRNEELKLIPAMEYFLMSTQWLDNPWNGKHDELVAAVKELAAKQETLEQSAPEQVKSEVSKSHAAVTKLKRKKNVWKVLAVVAMGLWLATMSISLYLRYMDRRQAELEANAQAEVKPVELNVGDSYNFGSYNGEEITWWVVEVEDGIATLFSKNIISMKGFEGAESGNNFYTKTGETKGPDRPFTPVENMEAFGSNDWEISSLRAWLNSNKNIVEYIGQKPTADSMCDRKNEYVNESGFLHDFTEDEIAALVPTSISTEYHNWQTSEISVKETQDYVYIPCKADIPLFTELDLNIYCEPTAKAIEKDNSDIYSYRCSYYELTTGYWWLRDPYEDSYSELVCVATGYNGTMFDYEVAAVAGIGVRPMLRVDISKLVAK